MIEIRYGYKRSKRLLNHSTFCGEAFDGHGAKFGLDLCLEVSGGFLLHLRVEYSIGTFGVDRGLRCIASGGTGPTILRRFSPLSAKRDLSYRLFLYSTLRCLLRR